MTNTNTAKDDGAALAPSSMTLAEVLTLLTLGGGLTLHVGEPASTTTLAATPGPFAPAANPPPSSGGGGGGSGVATATATSVPISAVAAGEQYPCSSCAAAGCLPPPPTVGRDEAGNGGCEASGSANPAQGGNVAEENDEVNTGRWYAVTRGRQVGVFSDWSEVAPLVVGVGSAVF
ncbi:hypothetical protein FPV67DRAFT_1672818 [Lyophyllum atratum]|nr:hypothetical protein FPV67DRAFT_1672818 [Lyophyllum atratum]